MYPRLLHLYGPIWIHSYGTMIALGFLLFLIISYYHPLRKKIVASATYLDIVFVGLMIGIVGGRLGFVFTHLEEMLTHWQDILLPWSGGFTAEGSIIALILCLPWYLRRYNVPTLPLLDLAAIHAPLIQGFGRLGCLLSGCCYGLPAPLKTFWAITFSDPSGFGPIGCTLYPTQWWMSIGSFALFFVLYGLSYRQQLRSGLLAFSYLFFTSLLRFTVDFWRGDREQLFMLHTHLVSRSQVIALSLMTISLLVFLYILLKPRTEQR